MSLRQFQRNPKAWVAAAVVTGVVAVSVLVYSMLVSNLKEEENAEEKTIQTHLPQGVLKRAVSDVKKYTNKSIALTLSHTILSSPLPLSDILLNAENVTFILPPNLSMEDLEFSVQKSGPDSKAAYNLPQTLIQNYKLLDCLNIQGYFNLIKNIKPDMLLVCSDDLGITNFTTDIHNFVKEIVNIDQNRDDVYTKVAPILIR